MDELQAYDAMIAFLQHYWEIRGKPSDDIALLLSNISRDVWANGMPGDPASWSDWQRAVSTAIDRSGG